MKLRTSQDLEASETVTTPRWTRRGTNVMQAAFREVAEAMARADCTVPPAFRHVRPKRDLILKKRPRKRQEAPVAQESPPREKKKKRPTFSPTREEIFAALESVFPPELNGAVEKEIEVESFSVPYDFELKCLKNIERSLE